MSNRAVVLGLATLLGYAAITLDGDALAADSASSQPVGGPQTIGSWLVSGAGGIAMADLTPAAITIPPSNSPAAKMITFELTLQYGKNGNNPFQGSTIRITHNLIPLPPNVPFHVLADGKDVGEFYDNAIGGDLTAMFGADLAGLASVQQFSIIIKNSPANNPPVFAANLQQTAAALAAMKTVSAAAAAQLSISETDGAWHLTADQGHAHAVPTAAATVINSVKLAPSLKPCQTYFALTYDGPAQGFDFVFDTKVSGGLFLPAEHQKDARLLLFTDGEEIDSIDAAKLPAGPPGSYAFGGVSYSKPLSDYFGKDLKGLVPVHNFKIVVRMAGVDTTIYEVNFSGTDKMLESLSQLRALSIQRMTSGLKPIRRRPTVGPGSTGFTPPPVGGIRFYGGAPPPAAPPGTGPQ